MKISRLAYDLSLQLTGLENKKILVALSGGLDSCVLLELLFEIRTRIQFEIAVAHIHHGDENCSESQRQYREKALAFARSRAALKNCEFYFEKSRKINTEPDSENQKSNFKGATKNLASEASLRNVRKSLLEKIRKEHGFELIAFAHHAQDLFETRLIRLLRGTGPNGMQAMKSKLRTHIRPILKLWPKEIAHYATHYKIEYLVDPSNQDLSYLRNWIRKKWLVDLEDKRPGSVLAFSRSIGLLSQNKLSASYETQGLQMNEAVIDRQNFKALSLAERQQFIADYLGRFAQANYSSNMVQEICKRLDTSRKHLTFKVAGLEWTANAKQIQTRVLN